MITIEKATEIIRTAKEFEQSNIDSVLCGDKLYFLACVKTLTDCLDVLTEKVKISVLGNGYNGETLFPEMDRKVVYSDGKITVQFDTEKIYTILKKQGKEKSFLEIVKIQKTAVDKSDTDVKAIAEKNSISEKGNPFISVLKLSKKDKING